MGIGEFSEEGLLESRRIVWDQSDRLLIHALHLINEGSEQSDRVESVSQSVLDFLKSCFGPAVGANSYHQAIFQNGPLALKERTAQV